jgi:universal stress protein E
MQTLKTILLATDLKPASVDAARAAGQLAAVFGARVALLYVMEPVPHWPESLAELRDKATRQLDEFRQRVAPHVVCAESLLVEGSPADVIVQKATELTADLVVIGAGEAARHARFAVGPIAGQVLEHAAQPVLAVRPGEPALRFNKILCPVDQSGPAARGLRCAVQFAHAFAGELVVLTVVPEVSWLSAAAETGQFAGAKTEYESRWREEFERFLANVPTAEAKVRAELRHGPAHRQILAAAQELQADLIVMGATGRTGLVRVLLGSTTRRLLEQLPCALLTVKDETLEEEAFESAVKLNRLLMAEGQALIAGDSPDAAIAKFRQVLAHNPFHAGAITGLADAYEKLGQHAKAQYYRSRVQKLNGRA